MEVEVRVGKLKNRKAAGKDEVKGEMIKGGGDRVDWIWRLCNMDFENGVVLGRLEICCDCSILQG